MMKTNKMEIQQSGRLIAGSLILAGALVLASYVYGSSIENDAIRIFVTTAVYMLGPLVSAIIVLPATVHKRWLYITATLMSWIIVIPWAFINPTAWVQDYMVQLGSYTNMMFFILLIAAVTSEAKSTKILWLITAVYLIILALIAFI